MSEITVQRQQLIDVFLEKNTHLNLSAIRDAEGVRNKHILDSLELTKIVNFPTGTSCLDVGTGGGFPLLPLAITYPEVRFTWLDARKKKVQAINEMVAQLGIHNVRVLRGRVEEHHNRYDIVTARAVAYGDQLMQRTLPLVKKWGTLALYKYRSHEEDDLLLTLMRQHHLTPIALHHYHLLHEATNSRILYVLQKKE